MFKTRTWLISSLASSLALFGACSAEDTYTPVNDTGDAIQRSAPAQTPFMSGKLGTIELPSTSGSTLRGKDVTDYSGSAQSFLNSFAAERLNATGTESFEAVSAHFDKLGNVAIRFNQYINGLPVQGAQLVVQADAQTGEVKRVNGQFVSDTQLSATPTMVGSRAVENALRSADITPEGAVSSPELTYVLDSSSRAVLAWQTEVVYTDDNGDPQRDLVFADAETGEMTMRYPQHKYARSLETIDCEQKSRCTVVASTSSNTISTGDGAIDGAHNYAIATYNYYSNNHGRDSIDNNGMTLISRAHYNRNYNNAFWDGSQMTYGDGDGTTFIPLSQDADVVAHELTHGVTERSSNLVYSNESGALNEALSDIFGSLVDRQEGASITDTWLLGEDIYTPGTPGDALRVMNDPSSVGDFDYYPTRYTGTSDNGGVHWNSGIANLAFVLVTQGGTHPAGATTINVPALDANFDTSHQMAGNIFYAANTGCLTSTSNFESARYCTADAASALYGSAAFDAVHAAWDAVGVPGDSTGGGGGGGGGGGTNCVGSVVVALNYTQTISANTLYSSTIDVPAGACNLIITTAGDNGDTDLYVKLGATATPSAFDYASTSPTSNETVSIASPAPGSWSVGVYGYRRSTNITVNGEYQNP